LELERDQTFLIRIGHKMRLRRTEWIAATQCAIWGVVLLLPSASFDSSAAFNVIKTWGREEYFGGVLLLIGFGRLISLYINGARKKITPWARLTGATLGAIIFTILSMGFAASGVVSTWLAAWPILAVIEYINIYDTAKDARQAHG
jgi:hypothetical protein